MHIYRPCTQVTSRIAYAMARDGAFPWSWALSPVNKYTQTPLYTVLLVFVVDSIMLLLPLGATQAFTAVTSSECIMFNEVHFYDCFEQ